MLSIAWAPLYAHPLPAAHRFPMLKYELLPEQLLREGVVTNDVFFRPTPPPEADILRVHKAAYYRRLCAGQLSRQEERATGFPWSPELIARETTILGGTLECARRARASGGVALNIAGGTHHAFRDRGEGFCLLNDQAAAAAYLLAHPELRVRRVLIIDLDVHQGNGTAAIFGHEPRVFTFSMHGARNYPHRKEQSDLDLPLPDGTDDAAYLALLHDTLPHLLAPAPARFRVLLGRRRCAGHRQAGPPEPEPRRVPPARRIRARPLPSAPATRSGVHGRRLLAQHHRHCGSPRQHLPCGRRLVGLAGNW